MKNNLGGVYVDLITPFDEKGKVNYNKLKWLIENAINAKINGVALLSNVSEEYSLTEKEKEKIVKFAIKVIKNRVKIFIYVGGNNFKKVSCEIKKFNNLKINAFLLNLPENCSPNFSGLQLYILNCLKLTNIPFILVNSPKRTGLLLSIKQFNKLCVSSENIIGIKDESNSLEFFNKLTKIKPNFKVYCGNDEVIDGALRLGSVGIISYSANICANEINKIYMLYDQLKIKEAQIVFLKIEEFINALNFDNLPASIKFAFASLGQKMGYTRLPIAGIELENKAVIREALTTCNIKITLN